MLDGLRSTPETAPCRGRGRAPWRRSSWRCTVLVTVSMATAASASGGWSSPTLVDSGGGGLSSVSCPTVKFCVAVDGAGRAVIHKRNNKWEAPSHVDPGGALTSVSCAHDAVLR